MQNVVRGTENVAALALPNLSIHLSFYLLFYKALRILTYTPVFEEVVGLSPTGSLFLCLILSGEGLPHKKVANALAGHQLGSKTVLTVKKSLGCCTLAEISGFSSS